MQEPLVGTSENGAIGPVRQNMTGDPRGRRQDRAERLHPAARSLAAAQLFVLA